MSATWGAVGRGWPVFVPVILVNAAAQAALVVDDPEPVASAVFVLLVLGSFAVLVAALAVSASAATAAVDRRALRPPGARLLLWATVAVLVVVGCSLVSPLLVPLGVVLAALLLPPVADGRSNPFPGGFTVFREHPVRTILALLATLAIVVLCWVVSLLLGFFVTGPIASEITWVWFGVIGVLLLCWFSSRYRRAVPATA